MADYINPFDFEKIFITLFAGSPEIFTAVAIISLSIGGGFFKMPNKVFLTLLGLFGIMFARWTGNAIYVLAIIIVGLIVFKGIAKIVT